MGGGRRPREDRAGDPVARRRGDRAPRCGRPAEVADALTLPRVEPLGDCALVVEVDDLIGERALRRVLSLLRRIEAEHLPGVAAAVPGFTNVTVHYQPHLVEHGERVSPWAALSDRLFALAGDLDELTPVPSREVDLPVCYAPAFAPDLPDVARHTGLTPEEVVALHGAATYLVHMIGFLPGFAYLGGLDPRLATPRRATPRTSVPAGSVGIGGTQTGVYPVASPGGWNLIGRTALPLLDLRAASPSVLRVGDRIRFRAVSEEEHRAAGGR